MCRLNWLGVSSPVRTDQKPYRTWAGAAPPGILSRTTGLEAQGHYRYADDDLIRDGLPAPNRSIERLGAGLYRLEDFTSYPSFVFTLRFVPDINSDRHATVKRTTAARPTSLETPFVLYSSWLLIPLLRWTDGRGPGGLLAVVLAFFVLPTLIGLALGVRRLRRAPVPRWYPGLFLIGSLLELLPPPWRSSGSVAPRSSHAFPPGHQHGPLWTVTGEKPGPAGARRLEAGAVRGQDGQTQAQPHFAVHQPPPTEVPLEFDPFFPLRVWSPATLSAASGSSGRAEESS